MLFTTQVRLTNPPLLAWAAWEAYQRANNTTFLRRVYPALAAYLTWDMTHRDTNNNSLLEWSVSFESGLDLSPRFDDGSDFDAVDFSAYAAHDALRLADIAGVLGLDADRSKWLDLASSISDAVHKLLWDDREGCYRDRFKNGSLSDVDSLPNFAPLLLPSTPASRVASMATRLRSPCYQTRWLFPTVSTCDRRFEVDCMRGGVWPALNWIFGEGLCVSAQTSSCLCSAAMCFNDLYVLSWLHSTFCRALNRHLAVSLSLSLCVCVCVCVCVYVSILLQRVTLTVSFHMFCS